MKFGNFSCQNRLIQVSKSMLMHRTHSPVYKSYHLKVDFFIQLLVKFQILINFRWQMLDFCLGCGNKKCWVWFPALIFLLLTFLFFWGNPYQAIQPVKRAYWTVERLCLMQKLASPNIAYLYQWQQQKRVYGNGFELKLQTAVV